jgi:uncharacterized protein YcaQ
MTKVVLNTLEQMRRFAVARNFSKPTTLKRALARMGFVQADPIRAPARAQDLILRQRVKDYRAGDLEKRYETLDIEEDFFINYGYVTQWLHALMHPRTWNGRRTRAQKLLEFVRERGQVHPREVDEHFSHGKVTNYWGGSSNATTHLMDEMHYRGLLRVVRREKGIRIYAVRIAPEIDAASDASATIDALVDVVVNIYAPLTSPSLSYYSRRLRYAAPQLQNTLPAAFQRAKARLSKATIDGVEWFWPSDEKLRPSVSDDSLERVRLLAPFDPLVHDRTRFKLLWGWEYRFEAYTPAPKRKLGYYAMPLLWRDQAIGWANLAVKNGELQSEFRYVESEPREPAFKRELAAEMHRFRMFVSL